MDIIIKNARVIDMVSREGEYASIAIDGGKIAAIGEVTGTAARTIDAGGKIVMPGLINTHTHVPMTIMRGLKDDVTLQDWLFNSIFPVEDNLTPDDVYWASLAGMCEMLASGTTCFCDMYMMSDKIAEAALLSGMRANISRSIVDSDGIDNAKKRIAESVELYKGFHGGKIKIDAAVHAVYTNSRDSVELTGRMADDYNMRMQVHISETETENRECIEKHGKSPAQILNGYGLFDRPTVAAHCVFLDGEDLRIFKEKNVHIAHNPGSNLKLASGVAPIADYIGGGINTALGTDGAASNNNQNMFKEIQLAATLHKGVNRDPLLISASEALKMATVNGAKALGREAEIGMIAPGMSADLIFVDTDLPHMYPMHNAVSAAVYSAMASDVSAVMIEGEFLYENREFKTMDYEKIKFEVDRIYNRLF